MFIKKESDGSDWTIYFKGQAVVCLPKFGDNSKDRPNFIKASKDTTAHLRYKGPVKRNT